jgi:hypothetical protein
MVTTQKHLLYKIFTLVRHKLLASKYDAVKRYRKDNEERRGFRTHFSRNEFKVHYLLSTALSIYWLCNDITSNSEFTYEEMLRWLRMWTIALLICFQVNMLAIYSNNWWKPWKIYHWNRKSSCNFKPILQNTIHTLSWCLSFRNNLVRAWHIKDEKLFPSLDRNFFLFVRNLPCHVNKSQSAGHSYIVQASLLADMHLAAGAYAFVNDSFHIGTLITSTKT